MYAVVPEWCPELLKAYEKAAWSYKEIRPLQLYFAAFHFWPFFRLAAFIRRGLLRVQGFVVGFKDSIFFRSSRTLTYCAVTASRLVEIPSDIPMPFSVCPNISPTV